MNRGRSAPGPARPEAGASSRDQDNVCAVFAVGLCSRTPRPTSFLIIHRSSSVAVVPVIAHLSRCLPGLGAFSLYNHVLRTVVAFTRHPHARYH